MPVKKEEIEALFKKTEDVFNQFLTKYGIVADIDPKNGVITVSGVSDGPLKKRIALIKKYIKEQRTALDQYESRKPTLQKNHKKPDKLFVAYQKAIFMRQNFLIDAIKSILPQEASAIALNEAMLQLIQDDLIEAGLAVPAPSVTPSLVAPARPNMPTLTSVQNKKPQRKVHVFASAPPMQPKQNKKAHPAQSSVDAFKLQQELNGMQSQFEATRNQFSSILQNEGSILKIESNQSLYEKRDKIEAIIEAQLARFQGFSPRDNPVTQKDLDALRNSQSRLTKEIQGFKNQLRIEPLRAGSKNLFSTLKKPFTGLLEPKQSGFFVRFLEESRAWEAMEAKFKVIVSNRGRPLPESFVAVEITIKAQQEELKNIRAIPGKITPENENALKAIQQERLSLEEKLRDFEMHAEFDKSLEEEERQWIFLESGFMDMLVSPKIKKILIENSSLPEKHEEISRLIKTRKIFYDKFEGNVPIHIKKDTLKNLQQYRKLVLSKINSFQKTLKKDRQNEALSDLPQALLVGPALGKFVKRAAKVEGVLDGINVSSLNDPSLKKQVELLRIDLRALSVLGDLENQRTRGDLVKLAELEKKVDAAVWKIRKDFLKNFVQKKAVQQPVTPAPENCPKMKFSIDPKYATPLLGDLRALLFSELDGFGEYAKNLTTENRTLMEQVKKAGKIVSKKIIVQDESQKDTTENIFVLKRAFGDQKPLAKICYSPISTSEGSLFDVSIYLLGDAAKLCTTDKDQEFAKGLAELLENYWHKQSLLEFEHFSENSKTVNALRDARWHAIPDPTTKVGTAPAAAAPITPVIRVVSAALTAAPKTSDVSAANDDTKSVTSEFSFGSLKSGETMETPSEFGSSKLHDVAGSASNEDAFEDVPFSDPAQDLKLKSVSSLDSAVPAEIDEEDHITLFQKGEQSIENADLTAANLNALPKAQHTFFRDSEEPLAAVVPDNTSEHDGPFEEIDLGTQAKSGNISILRPFKLASAFLGGLYNRLPNVKNILGTLQAGTTQKKKLKGDTNRVRASLVKRWDKAKKGLEKGLNKASDGAKDKLETVGKSLQKKPPIPHTKVSPNGIPQNDFSPFVFGSDSLGEELKTVQEQFESAQALEDESNVLTFRAVLANPMNSESHDTVSLDPNDWEDPDVSKPGFFFRTTAPQAFNDVYHAMEKSIKSIEANAKKKQRPKTQQKNANARKREMDIYQNIQVEKPRKDKTEQVEQPEQFDIKRKKDEEVIVTVKKHKKKKGKVDDKDALSVVSKTENPAEDACEVMLHSMWLAKRKDLEKTVLIEGCDHDPALALRFYMGCIVRGLNPQFLPATQETIEKHSNPALQAIYKKLEKNKDLYLPALRDIKAAMTEQKRTFLPEAKARVQKKLEKAQVIRDEAKEIIIEQKRALEAIKKPSAAPTSHP